MFVFSFPIYKTYYFIYAAIELRNNYFAVFAVSIISFKFIYNILTIPISRNCVAFNCAFQGIIFRITLLFLIYFHNSSDMSVNVKVLTLHERGRSR